MWKSLAEGVRSIWSSSTNDISASSSGTKRKRTDAELDDDPDVQIIRVEKKKRTTPPNSFVKLLKHSASRMAEWVWRKPMFAEEFRSRPKEASDRWRETSSNQRNGNPLRGPRVNGDERAPKHFIGNKDNLSRDESSYGSSHPLPYHDVSSGRSRQSSTSSSVRPNKLSTASMCIRLKDKEEYQKMLQLQTSPSLWQPHIFGHSSGAPLSSRKLPDSDAISVSSNSSSCDASLFGSTNSLTHVKKVPEPHSIPKYKTIPNKTYLSATSSSRHRQVMPKDIEQSAELSFLLAKQRRRSELKTSSSKETSDKSPLNNGHSSAHSVSSSRQTSRLSDLSKESSEPILIEDDEEEVKVRKNSLLEQNTSLVTSCLDRGISQVHEPDKVKLDFRNSKYNKDQYLEDILKSRQMKAEQLKRHIEDAQLKARAYQEKRLAQEIGLEKKLKYQMRIFDQEPEVCEEIFLEESEDEEESLPELTSEMDEVIRAALRQNPGHEVLSEAFRLQITRRDMATLGGLNWLNDEIINFYMNMLMERGEQEGKSKVYAFNTFFYPKIMSGGHSAVKRWTKKVDIFAMHFLLIPVHLGMHWCLCVADMKDKKITYYDSMGGKNHECLMAVRKYINDESVAKKGSPINQDEWKLVTAQDNPQQMNGSDCGMFACKYAEYITRGKDITFTQEDMPYFRRRMVFEIMTKKLLQ